MLGILGGMGPLATTYFYKKIIEKYPATKDQDHIPTVIISDPGLPDRTAAILGNQTDVVEKELLKRLKKLEAAGATVIAMPCNTAHYWAPALQKQSHATFVHMIEAVGARLRDQLADQNPSQGHNIGLFSTVGTAKTGIYQTCCKPFGLNVISPPDDIQEKVNQIIANVKGNGNLAQAYEAILQAANQWKQTENLHTIILGCTELPLPFQGSIPEGFIDPMDVLADKVISLFDLSVEHGI